MAPSATDKRSVVRDPNNPRFYDPDWAAWEQRRRWPWAVVVLAIAGAVIGFYLTTLPQSHKHVAVVIPAIPANKFSIPGSGAGQPAPQYFAGKGGADAVVIHNVHLDSHVAVFQMHCHCHSNFAVELATTAGAPVAFLVNTTVPYNGVVAVPVTPGVYDLNVVADLGWRLKIYQPTNEAALVLPKNYQGSQDAAIGPFSLQPTTSMKLIFIPFFNANLSMTLIPAAGGPAQNIATVSAKIFPAEHISLRSVSAGSYYLEIRSGGFWDVQLSP